MKKKGLIYAALILTLISTSCDRGKHVSIRTDANGVTTSLEYYGKISFSEDNMSIRSMAPNSYIKFENSGQKLIARRYNGTIIYELNNGTKTNQLNSDDKMLIAEVLKKVGKMDKK